MNQNPNQPLPIPEKTLDPMNFPPGQFNISLPSAGCPSPAPSVVSSSAGVSQAGVPPNMQMCPMNPMQMQMMPQQMAMMNPMYNPYMMQMYQQQQQQPQVFKIDRRNVRNVDFEKGTSFRDRGLDITMTDYEGGQGFHVSFKNALEKSFNADFNSSESYTMTSNRK